MEKEHLKPIYEDKRYILVDSDISDSDSSDSDGSSIEIRSTIDGCENELINLSTYLQLHSEDENSEENEVFEWPEPPSPLSLDLPDGEVSNNPHRIILSPTTLNNNNNNIQETLEKHKRRQWSIKEKLDVIEYYDKNHSKRKTAKRKGCTTAQLRNWLRNKDDLLKMNKKKKGGERKRVEGGGKKLVYADLDHRLFKWYRSRRTNPNDTSLPASEIRREKVTLKHLQKQAELICQELNQKPPSTKWYYRFLKRNHLSLQRPKRQDKVPIDEVHRLANSFYSYNRRASTWSLKRGVMGCFVPEDISNMDESPLALFGDQATKSINDIGTSNEINGYISNKRFCTVILTVFAENQRMDPVVLFKGKCKIGADERQQYAKGVLAIFTPKSFINGPSMDLYIKTWLQKVDDGYPKLLIADSAGPHLNPEKIRELRKKKVVVSIIPKGCTSFLQLLDTSVFSIFKHYYRQAADEYIDSHGSRSNIKLSAKQQRILCTRLVSTAWIRTKNNVNFEQAFLDIGYTWVDNSPVSIRTLPGFVFNPSTITSSINTIDEVDEEEENEGDGHLHMLSVNKSIKMKQLNLDQFLRK